MVILFCYGFLINLATKKPNPYPNLSPKTQRPLICAMFLFKDGGVIVIQAYAYIFSCLVRVIITSTSFTSPENKPRGVNHCEGCVSMCALKEAC